MYVGFCILAQAVGVCICGDVRAGAARRIWRRSTGGGCSGLCDECTLHRSFSSFRAFQKHNADKHNGAAEADASEHSEVGQEDREAEDEDEEPPTKRGRLA